MRAPGGTLRIDQPPVALKDNRGDGSGHKRSLWWAMARCWMWRPRGRGAAGGVLSVALETPVYENTSVDLVRVQRELLIRQQAAASLPDVADPRAARRCATATASWRWTATGTAALAPSMCCPMDSSAPAAPSICGPARPSACSPARSLAEGGPPDTRFGVNAPYVLLAQTDRPNADFLVLPTVHGGLSKQDPTGAFAVHGNTVDVRDRVSFGANGYFLLQGRVLRTVDGQGLRQRQPGRRR